MLSNNTSTATLAPPIRYRISPGVRKDQPVDPRSPECVYNDYIDHAHAWSVCSHSVIYRAQIAYATMVFFKVSASDISTISH